MRRIAEPVAPSKLHAVTDTEDLAAVFEGLDFGADGGDATGLSLPPPLTPRECLRAYRLSPDHEHRLKTSLDRWVRQAVNNVHHDEHTSRVQVVCYGLSQARPWLLTHPDLQAIITAHQTVIDAGGDTEVFEKWSFRPEWQGLQPVWYNNVPPKLKAWYAKLAEKSGLAQTVLHGLGLCHGLRGLSLPIAVADHLDEYEDAFCQALKTRAIKTTKIAASVQPSPKVIYQERPR